MDKNDIDDKISIAYKNKNIIYPLTNKEIKAYCIKYREFPRTKGDQREMIEKINNGEYTKEEASRILHNMNN